jgi:hypothetical protein
MAKRHVSGGPGSWEEGESGQKRTALAGRRLLAADRRYACEVYLGFPRGQIRFYCRYLYEYKAAAARNERRRLHTKRRKERFLERTSRFLRR